MQYNALYGVSWATKKHSAFLLASKQSFMGARSFRNNSYYDNTLAYEHYTRLICQGVPTISARLCRRFYVWHPDSPWPCTGPAVHTLYTYNNKTTKIVWIKGGWDFVTHKTTMMQYNFITKILKYQVFCDAFWYVHILWSN